MKNGNSLIIYASMLIAALLILVFFNLFTTLDTVAYFLGRTPAVWGFSIALSLVDFAGLARLITPAKSMKDEPMFVWVALGIWIVSAFFDLAMTSLWVEIRMGEVQAQFPAAVPTFVKVGFPWIIAFGEFSMRVPLVMVIGGLGEQVASAIKSVARAPRPSLPAPTRPVAPSSNPNRSKTTFSGMRPQPVKSSGGSNWNPNP